MSHGWKGNAESPTTRGGTSTPFIFSASWGMNLPSFMADEICVDWNMIASWEFPGNPPNESTVWVYHCHHHNRIKAFEIMVLLAGFQTSSWTLDRNVTAVNGCPAIRKLLNFFSLENVLFKIFTFRHVFAHRIDPHVSYYCSGYFFTAVSYTHLTLPTKLEV